MSDPARIIVFDTTLRDGEQAPGFSMDVPAKLTMAHALDALGVDIIEAGFPIASPADAEAVRQIALTIQRPVIAARCTTVKLPDTVGYATPHEIRHFFADIIARVPNADRAMLSAHCHNDLGLAVANSLAAIQGGVRQVECAMNGIGERAGNASLEELVMALRVRQDRLPYDTEIKADALFETSQLLAQITAEPVQANKAIVGR